MTEFNIIPIEDHQVTLAEDFYLWAQSTGLIDALKKFASTKFKKDRKIKITKFTDADEEPSWRVDLLSVFGECLWSSEFLNYQDAKYFKKSIEEWCSNNAKILKDQPYKYVVWENWNTATSGHVSQIHITTDARTTLCNKKIPFVGEKRKPDFLPEGSRHAVKLGDIPKSGWDSWWFNRQGIKERTQAVSYHDKLSDFDYSNELGTSYELKHLEQCECCAKRKDSIK
tara:strand:+ start:237 stop:917 length:681 start_codon:yes stop_codon:yes gene_type:complete